MRTANDIGLGLLRQPKLVFFGPGQRAQLPNILRPLGSKVLITTDARMASSSEFLAIVESLEAAEISSTVYSRIEPDLPRENIVELVEQVGAERIDAVLAVGGGSCLDAAKIAAIVLAHGGDVRDVYGENLVKGPGLPVVTVPTTGGTGAEATCISVIYDAERGMKVGVASPFLEPYAAVVDPELTLSCPPGLTAATGADALSHLIESFTDIAKNPTVDEINSRLYVGKNVLTDMYCAHGLALLNASLDVAYREPNNLRARSDVMLAAFSAGMAINTAGTAGAHAIQSPIGALTNTPHGFGVGTLLPFIMRFNLPAREAEFAEIGRIFGVADPASPEREQARAAILRVDEILAALRIPADLNELGLKPEQFGYVADQAMLATRLTANNPRALTQPLIVSILERAYNNDRSWWDD